MPGGIFDFGGDLEKLLNGELFNPKDKDTLRKIQEMDRKTASDEFYINIFEKACGKNDTFNMIELIKHHEARIDEKNHNKLSAAYAKVCVQVGNLKKAYDKLERLAKKREREIEVMGLLSYQMENHPQAVAHLNSIKPAQPLSAVTCAISMYQTGERDIQKYSALLKPVESTLNLACGFLGVLYFNAKDFAKAEECFKRGKKIKPKSEFTQLGLLCIAYQQEGIININKRDAFFMATNSRKTEEEINQLTKSGTIEIPTLDLAKSNLMYKLVYTLLK